MGIRILIVDEDDLIQDLVCRTVSVMGHSSLPVSNIAQAKSECSITLPDLIILDLCVSGKTGIDFCKWVRTQPGGDLIPILILTEVTDQNGKAAAVKYKVTALEEGADDFLTKPFMFQELKARLGALLRARSLSLRLTEQNRLLEEAHEKIVMQERQLCATQLAGAAAHTLGQPLTAMKLNCHLLETLPQNDSRHDTALKEVKGNINKLIRIIEGLRNVDAAKTENYHSGVDILEVKEE